MKRALISDIHGNFTALEAVLEDIRQQSVDEILCLGDIIGYGPNPCECLEAVMKECRVTILGNHDQAAVFDPDGFNPVAYRAIIWTRDKLDKTGPSSQIDKRWDFLGDLPRTHDEGEYLFVHGSPREPTNEYVFPEDAYKQRKMEALFGRIENYCFQGHTHIPGVFEALGDGQYSFSEPDDFGGSFQLGETKVMINVGSVGQPRDNDSRSCYVILDTDAKTIEFRRVAYEVERTAKQIYAVEDLDNMLGDRLLSGR